MYEWLLSTEYHCIFYKLWYGQKTEIESHMIYMNYTFIITQTLRWRILLLNSYLTIYLGKIKNINLKIFKN